MRVFDTSASVSPPYWLVGCWGVDAGVLPPGGFIAYAVASKPMMDSAERRRELVARLVTQGSRLQMAQVRKIC